MSIHVCSWVLISNITCAAFVNRPKFYVATMHHPTLRTCVKGITLPWDDRLSVVLFFGVSIKMPFLLMAMRILGIQVLRRTCLQDMHYYGLQSFLRQCTAIKGLGPIKTQVDIYMYRRSI